MQLAEQQKRNVCSTEHLDKLVRLYGLDQPTTSSPTALCTNWLRKGSKEVVDTACPAGRCQTAPRFNIPKVSWDCQATRNVASYPKNKDRNTWPKTPQERAGLVVTYPGISEARDKYTPPPKAVTEVFSNYGVLQQLQPGYRVNPHQDYHIKGWSPLLKREPTGSETTEYKLNFTWPFGVSTQYAANSCYATETSMPEGMKALKVLGSEPYASLIIGELSLGVPIEGGESCRPDSVYWLVLSNLVARLHSQHLSRFHSAQGWAKRALRGSYHGREVGIRICTNPYRNERALQIIFQTLESFTIRTVIQAEQQTVLACTLNSLSIVSLSGSKIKLDQLSDVKWKRLCDYRFRTAQTYLAASTEVCCCGYSQKLKLSTTCSLVLPLRFELLAFCSHGNEYTIGTKNGAIKERHSCIPYRIVALFLLSPFAVALLT
ncbi:hypothetical protein CSKR_107725 [Clonorchis sinensis]|uniref:Uncharacterized protein n=1 Tax=Clonorchis sinensis TaxID=79923 RepID=A0A8T1MIP9_CLOSI|nr:hypothetical protein CSKR_107725 [Clonorchis sinensis]